MTTTARIACPAALLALAASVAAQVGAEPGDTDGGGYLTPPQEIVGILDAPPTPGVLVSPNRGVIVLTERRSMPPISWQARPLERLAG
ncbi:MAG: S9 family peptidase, partial [Acidobacteria bacterium]|nr:S9 family peptidase [Acidobacteriota bacterium]